MESKTSRRNFLTSSAGAALGTAAFHYWAAPTSALAAPIAGLNRGRILKSVKWGMIRGTTSVLERFQICKDLGYDGMELISPADFSADEVQKAKAATGMPVHGVVDMRHWKQRLSSPDAKVRANGVEILRRAIRDASAFGGDTVLLVPGKVTGPDENHDHVWQRSIVGIRKVLPEASRLGVRVLIENVWNGFCETPEQLRDYIDEIESPWVGSYFDIGNAIKFGPSENWIRVLGRRIVKLDIKGWSKKEGFGKIGDGDGNWPEIRRALAEINYSGWCTAEVKGGDRKRLADIAQRVDRALDL